MNYILKERYSIFTHKISLNYYKKINILYYVKPTESANVSLIRLVLLLFDVEQQEDARERSCLLISEPHSPELESQYFHPHRKPLVRSAKRSGETKAGICPSWEEGKRGNRVSFSCRLNLLHHGRRSGGRRGNPVLTNSELY